MIGDNIRKFRKQKKMTQKRLGELVGVSEVMISQWERGERNPKFDNLMKIWKALDVSMSQLVEGAEGAWQYYSEDIAKDWGRTLKDDLIKHFDLLNDAGQLEAIRDVEKLTKIPEYKK